MATKIYGASDDLIEAEGDVCGEVGAIAASDLDQKTMIFFSDGTVLCARYEDDGMWRFSIVSTGSLYERTEPKAVEDDEGHSDIVYFKDGLKFAYVGFDCQKVQ